MKAIYINLDPYLAAFAAWQGPDDTPVGPGPAPSFDPLPLAVTIPLGESVAIAIENNSIDDENKVVVDGVDLYVKATAATTPQSDPIAQGVSLGLSAFSGADYDIYPVSGDISVVFEITSAPGDVIGSIPFTVLVRREQPQGPVDLVDFTPPAAALTAAAINTALGGSGAAEGQPLKGVSLTNATNAPAPTAAQINTALGGTGAEQNTPLAGVNLGAAKLLFGNKIACEYEGGSEMGVGFTKDIADTTTITSGLLNLSGAS